MILWSLVVTICESVLAKLFGYFLSPEFTVYPYFWSKGMLPYLHILDQHPPFLFFGPFSLPTFITSNPTYLLSFWFIIVYFINLIVIGSVKTSQLKTSVLLFSSWVIFSGHTLWTDTFLALFLLIYLVAPSFLAGISLSFIILLRPTYLPLAFVLFFFRRPKRIFYFLSGLLPPILIIIYFLYHQNLIQNAFYYIYTFNKDFYIPLASKFPTFRELILAFLFISPFVPLLTLKEISIAILLFLPAVPRFEMSHLFGLSIFLIYLSLRKSKKLLVPLIIIPLAVSLVSLIRHPIGNYYYQPRLYQIALKIESLPASPLLVIGESDLLYPMTNRLPPGMTYLPMLPWYINDKRSLDTMLANLLVSPSTIVVVDRQASLSGVKIIDRLDTINKVVNLFYQPVATIGSTTIYNRL